MTSIGARLCSAQPGLRVADLAAAEEFYGLLGFEVVHRNGEVAAVVQRDGVVLRLSTQEGSSPNSCHLVVEGIDGLHEEAMAAGAEVLFELGDRPWGARDFTIADPSGNQLTFSQRIRETIDSD